MTRIYRLVPDRTRTTLRVVEADPEPTPHQAAELALATLRMYARMLPGHRLEAPEIEAARAALRGLGRTW